ncbi:hypothetical protein CDIK_1749 [Cucumispora dikerogammari]|nr:hypothetical protein CDIK_1749 [Cucumispora dikerogammari]
MTKAFASCDIPFSKLVNSDMKEIFYYMGFQSPSKGSLIQYLINNYCSYIVYKVSRLLEKQKNFLVVDESEINETKYFNIMTGLILNPKAIFLLKTVSIKGSVNSSKVIENIIYNLKEKKISTEDVLLIISDIASYMIKATSHLKNVYVNMNHISCIAHLAHNCVLKIKTNYKRVNLLIDPMKAITVKNHTNRNIFNEIGPIPPVIVTRWNSWLSGALYYARNLPQIKKLILKVESGGILAEKTKMACPDTLLVTELFEVKKITNQ